MAISEVIKGFTHKGLLEYFSLSPEKLFILMDLYGLVEIHRLIGRVKSGTLGRTKELAKNTHHGGFSYFPSYPTSRPFSKEGLAEMA